jgi:hypothetical protein
LHFGPNTTDKNVTGTLKRGQPLNRGKGRKEVRNKRRVKGCEKWGRFKVLETERRVKGWEKG